MKMNFVTCGVALLMLTSAFQAHATSIPTQGCSAYYNLEDRKTPTGEIVGKILMAPGIGLAASAGGGVVIVFNAATNPIFIPIFAGVLVGAGVMILSDKIHHDRAIQARDLIEGAYTANAEFDKTLEKINQELKRKDRSAMTASELSQILQAGNENRDFCPVVKIDRHDRPKHLIFSEKQIRRYVVARELGISSGTYEGAVK